MTIVYIPNPGQSLGQTRDDVNQNFQQIDMGFTVNHVQLGSGANAGKHNFVEMPNYVPPPLGNPTPVTLAGERGFYAALSLQPPNTASAVFLANENSNMPGIEITYALKATNGWTVLPSGIKLQWGNAGGLGAGDNTVTFTVAFTATPFNVQVTGTGASGTAIFANVSATTMTNFTVNLSNRSGPVGGGIYWYAIGI